jgi:hypothetical protein
MAQGIGRVNQMIERHTIDFARVSFNIVSDADRATITLQFDQAGGGRESIPGILRAIQRRFGGGVMSRLNRWSTGESNPFVLPQTSRPHPDYPDVICFAIGLKPGARMEAALATFLDFLQQLPGYQRTYGSPLDRDEVPPQARKKSPRDVSAVAAGTLREFFKRRTKRSADR